MTPYIEGMNEKVAILGWGSLLWDPHPFDDRHHEWNHDGPVIPVEFSRVSTKRKGALTLVLDPKHGAPTQVAYSISKHGDSHAAHRDLLARERAAHPNYIGLFRRNAGHTHGRARDNEGPHAAIAAWAHAREIDAVVWTNFPADFERKLGRAFSVAAAKDHLKALPRPALKRAVAYIHRAPPFVRTPLRKALLNENWFRRLADELERD